MSGSTVNISEMECNIIMTVCQHMQKHLGFTNVQFRKYPIICVRDIDHWILQWVSLADDWDKKLYTENGALLNQLHGLSVITNLRVIYSIDIVAFNGVQTFALKCAVITIINYLHTIKIVDVGFHITKLVVAYFP